MKSRQPYEIGSTFYHVGMVVADLDQAMDELASTLGLSWASVQRREFPLVVRGERVRREIEFVYSFDGPPYLELIQAGEPPWEAQAGVHHLGVWTGTFDGDVGRAAERGYETVAIARDRPGYAGGFAYLRSPSGTLIEYVDLAGRSSFDNWIAGGDFA